MLDKQKIKARYISHIRESKLNSSYKSNWIKKLYKDNKYLLMDIIDICNKEDYSYYEKYYISLYKSLGYNLLNMTDGGEGLSGYKYTLDDRLKRSNRMKGSGNTFYGKRHTQESLKLMSINSINDGINNPMYGKNQKEESKRRMSLKKKGLYDGIKNPRAKKLYQYDIDNKLIKIWDYAKECADYYKISRGNISTFAKHNTNSDKFRILKGFVFKFN